MRPAFGWGSNVLLAAMLVGVRPGLAGAGEGCPDADFSSFERQGYRVSQVRLAGPLSFLGGAAGLTPALQGLPQAGQPFSVAALEAGKQSIRSTLLNRRDAFDSAVALSVVVPDVEACREAENEPRLDVVYWYLTTKVPLALDRTFESKAAEERDPGEALGLVRSKRASFAPRFAYDAAQRFQAGARVSLESTGLVEHLEAAGAASSAASTFEVSAAGAGEWTGGLIRRLEWSLCGDYHDLPTKEGALRQGRGNAVLRLASQPLGRSGGVLRVGTLLEYGTQQSGLAPAEEIPPPYVSSTSYGGARAFVGVGVKGRRHGLSLSYGLQLGSTGSALDYLKQVVDWAGDLRVAPHWVDSHRPFQVESRLTLGWLRALGATPVNERFFGGGAEIPFVPGETWRIRASPVVRSIPGLWLDGGVDGPGVGGDRFASFNATLSMPVWHRPLVPDEIARQAEVTRTIDGALATARSTVVREKKVAHPAHREVVSRHPETLAAARAVRARLAELVPSAADVHQAALRQCQAVTDELLCLLEELQERDYRGTLIDPDEDPSIPSVNSCVAALGAALPDPPLLRLGEDLARQGEWIGSQLDKIDVAAIERQADRELEFPRRTVEIVFEEMDLVAISPVLLFDVANLRTSSSDGRAGTQYALGGGIRLSVASTVHLTLAYAANPRPRGGLPHGAFTATLAFGDVFGR